MAIDKSLKQHYEMQGGVKNYLGKQKMVKAPKHWLSKPGHVKAKLAYITDEEEQILIDKNLYGSLRGRPNIGPAGLPSLQGGDFGAGRSDSGSRNGGNGSHDRGGWQHHRAATQPRQTVTVTPKSEPKDDPITRHHGSDTPVQKLEQKILNQLQAKEKEKFERDQDYMDLKAKAPTTFKPKVEKYITHSPFTDKPIINERVKKYSPTYYQDRSRIDGKTYGERAEAGMKRGFLDSGLGTLAKGAATALAWPLASAFVPPKLMTGLTWGKRGYDLKQGKYDTALQKLGINRSNLISNIEKAKGRQFDPKDSIGWTGEQKRNKTFHEGKGDGEATIAQQVTGGQDVVTKTANQFAGTEVEGQIQSLVQNNLNLALRHYADMYSRIEKGYSPNRQEKDVFKLLEHYLNQAAPKQQGAAYGGRIDKALTGRSRDI